MAKPKLVEAGVTLRNQINKRWPKRDKRSDGWIGDAAHQARKSDHNPDIWGWVHAIDVDHNMGPAGPARQGGDAQRLADQLIQLAREGKDMGRLKYVIYNNRIASGTYKNQFWTWRPGNWGHTQHIHISFNSVAKNNGQEFNLPIFKEKDESAKPTTPSKPAPPKPKPVPKFPGQDRLTFRKRNETVRRLQKELIAKGYSIPAGATGFYGNQTEAAVKRLYRDMGKLSNGRSVGLAAWKYLFGK
jgi:hypothetical protein